MFRKPIADKISAVYWSMKSSTGQPYDPNIIPLLQNSGLNYTGSFTLFTGVPKSGKTYHDKGVTYQLLEDGPRQELTIKGPQTYRYGLVDGEVRYVQSGDQSVVLYDNQISYWDQRHLLMSPPSDRSTIPYVNGVFK